MKDVAASMHNLRRSSFANTLAELPEVEEASQSGNDENKHGRLFERVDIGTTLKKGQGDAQLPVSGDGNTAEMIPNKTRHRLYSLPEDLSKGVYTNTSYSDSQRRASSDSPLKGGYARQNTHIQQTNKRNSHVKGNALTSTNSPMNQSSKNGSREYVITNQRRGSTDSKPHYRRYSHPVVHRKAATEPKNMSSLRNDAEASSGGRHLNNQHRENTDPKPIYRRYSHPERQSVAPRKTTAETKNLSSPRNDVKATTGEPYLNREAVLQVNQDSHGTENPQTGQDSEEITEAMLSKRRWSRPNFAITSRRVSMLLKSTNAMRGEKKRLSPQKITPTTSVPEELPKQPRFSAFMSPEAQYALMKGYEDIICDKLTQKYPEYGGMLKRNRTPKQKINIRRKSLINGLEDANEEDEDEVDEDDTQSNFADTTSDFHGEVNGRYPKLPETDAHKLTSIYVTSLQVPVGPKNNARSLLLCSPANEETTITPIHLGNPPAARGIYASSIVSEPPKQTPTAALKNLRRLSHSLEQATGPKKLFEDEFEQETEHNGLFPLQRYNSLPSVCTLSNDRRLVLTYRLENAMDILDTIKGQGEIFLSPRVKVRPRRLAPLSDYNSWANDWSREFKIEPSKS